MSAARWWAATEGFVDREDAGRLLAERVASEIAGEDAVVLALPRGGVPIGYQLASKLRAPLDVLLVRKLGVPWQPELAFGAVATGGVVVLNEDYVVELGLGGAVIREVVERERLELERRERLYRDEHPPTELLGRTAVVVDDGIATGSTVRAALESLAERGARRRIVAAPVAARETIRSLEAEADSVICLRTPVNFAAVGAWYEDFSPVSDEEVRALLRRSRAEVAQKRD